MSNRAKAQWQAKTESLFRLFTRVDENTGCWVWLGRKNPRTGYGELGRWYRGKWFVLAHRLAYTVLVAPICEGYTIEHKCRNRACCNPSHLEQMTFRENLRRRDAARRRDERQQGLWSE